MGLFDFFSRGDREKAAPAKPRETLTEYSGMRVEVLTEDKDLLFIARLVISGGGGGELQRTSETNVLPEWGDSGAAAAAEDGTAEEAAAEAKPPEPTYHVFLRGYDERQKQAIHMEADMTHYLGRIWRAQNLKVVGKDNDRAFFRQDVGSDGDVTPVDRTGRAPAPCKVVNISAGGACIRTDRIFRPGETLLLKSRLLPDSELSPLLCTVCRVTERKNNMYDYGCRFSELDAATEDQISKAILQLQLRRMRR